MNLAPRTGVISRRSVFSGLAAGGLGLAAASLAPGAGAQAQPVATSLHPIVGTWLVRSAGGLGLATFAADGSFSQAAPASQMGPQRVVFASALLGRWESAGPRSVRYTALQMLSDGDGTFTGTRTFHCHPIVGADGLSLLDDAPETDIVTRDASNQVVAVVGGNGGAPPMVGRRISPDTGIFQPGPPATEPQGT